MDQAGDALRHPVVTGALAACESLSAATACAAWQCSDDDVEGALGLLDRVDALTCALRAVLLREADDRSMKDRTRAPSTERWLTDRFRLSRAEASARVRQSHQLGGQPVVESALAAGEITVEQARVCSTALDHIDALPRVAAADRAEAAGLLVTQAAALGPRELARAGQALVEALTCAPSVDDPADVEAMRREQERAEAEAQAAERNQLTVRRRPGGRVQGRFDLGPLGSAHLLAWLREVDQPAKGEDGFEDLRVLPERRGDALVDLLGGSCGRSPGGSERDVAVISPGALLTLTVTLAELRAGLASAAVLDTGAPVSAATMRQLACDALVVPAVMGGPSKVLDLGRATPTWSVAQRRAIRLRDRLCTAPGCDRPPQDCHVHHEWEWEAGGPTDIANGALLCEFHHRMVHRQGWTVRLAANGWPEFIPPACIDPERRPRQHHRYALRLLITRMRS